MNTTARAALLALALALSGALPAAAQRLREVHGWSTWGMGAVVALPVGEFSDFVGVHPGFAAAVTLGGPVGLRIGGALLVYGHERQGYWFPSSGSSVVLGVTTDNLIATLGIGPQATLDAGPLRLYGYGTIGFSYFATVSSLGDGCGCYPLAETTDFDDWALAREAGGGLQVRLARRRPVFLDLSARYLRNGRVRYLPEHSLVEFSDGTIGVQPVESFANLVTFQAGLSVGLR